MFRKKKDIEERGRTLLKNKDVKGLRQDLLNAFPSLTEKKLDDLFFSYSPSSNTLKAIEMLQIKLVNRTLLYSINNTVLFFDLHGKKQYIPTCYTLWKIPYLFSKEPLAEDDEAVELSLKTEDKEKEKDDKKADKSKKDKADDKKKGKKDREKNVKRSKKSRQGANHSDEEAEEGEDDAEEVEPETVQEEAQIAPETAPTNLVRYSGLGLTPSLYQKLSRGAFSLLIPSQASSFLLKNGADLMSAGVLSCPSGLAKDEIVAISIRGNLMPFAVGRLVQSSEEMAGRQGKAVEVMHVYGDCLCSADAFHLEGKASGVQLEKPNDGFSLSQVFPVQPDGAIQKEGEGEGDCESEVTQPVEGSSSSQDSQPVPEQDQEEADSDPDRPFEEALVLCVKYIVKDKYLPLLASTFWAQVQKCSPVPLDPKKSSFSKISTLVLHYQKQGLLTCSTDLADLKILSVNRDHALLRTYKAKDLNNFKLKYQENGGKFELQVDKPEKTQTSQSSNDFKVSVQELYKIPKPLRHLVTLEDEDEQASEDEHSDDEEAGKSKGFPEYGIYYKNSELKEVLLEKIEKEIKAGLVVNEGSSFRILNDSIFFEPFYMKKATKTEEKPKDKPIDPPPQPSYEDFEDEEFDYTNNSSIDFSAWSESSSAAPKAPVFIKPDPVIHTMPKKPSDWGFEKGRVLKPISLSEVAKKEQEKKAELQKKKEEQKAAEASLQSQTMTASNEARRQEKKKDKEKREAECKDKLPYSIKKSELLPLFINKLSKYHLILKSSGDYIIRSGEPTKILLFLDRRSARQCSTQVFNLDKFGIDLALFSRALQKLFSCSVSLSPTGITIQGNFTNEIQQYLIDNFSFPRKYIEISDKKVHLKK